jgi:MFS family permease
VRRLFLLVGATILVDTMFFAALTPLLPQYADELELSKAEAGLLAAGYPIGVLATGIPSGFATARLGVKPTMLAGLALMASATVAFGFLDDYGTLLAARTGQGAASSLAWTAALSWLVARAPAGRRGELIGSAMAAAIVGALLGPVLGGAASVVGTETAFATVAAFAALLAAGVATTPAPAVREQQPASAVLRALVDPRVLGAAWFVCLPALLFGTLGVLAPLRLDALGLGAPAIGAAFLVAAAGEAVLAPVLGRVSDRRGRLVPLRAGLVAAGAVALVLPWLDHRFLLAPCVVVAGLSFGSFWAPALSNLTDEAEARGLEHAHGFALTSVAWAPAQAAGAAGGGALAGATSDAVPYVLLAFLCALTLLLTRRWRSGNSS